MTPTELIAQLRNRQHDRPIDRAIALRAADEIERLRGVLELIRNHGGCTTTDEGLTCTGSWCGEQARRALEGAK